LISSVDIVLLSSVRVSSVRGQSVSDGGWPIVSDSSSSIAAPRRSSTSGEEAAHHQASGDLGRNTPGLQVEQLLVVETPRRGGVSGALDESGLDLQVRHRIGPGAVGEHQVAVQLVGVGTFGSRPDQHVTDPHGVCGLALQGSLVDDVAAAAWAGVIDE
jgi:hypothetical protein